MTPNKSTGSGDLSPAGPGQSPGLPFGIITGLTAEARLAAPLGQARAGGGTPRGATLAAEYLVAQGATSLISFGVAGGLNPALPPGTIVIPAHILTASRTYTTDPALTARLGGPRHLLYAGTEIIVTCSEKHQLHTETGADAIDLESASVAAVAAKYSLPFAAIRAILDPASETLPPAALASLDAAGAIAIGRVLASLLRHPGQLPNLISLARHAAIARSALRRHVLSLAQINSE
jgi:adenosylhomocysteine nucleosidase